MACCPLLTAWRVLVSIGSVSGAPGSGNLANSVSAIVAGMHEASAGMAWRVWLGNALPWVVTAWSVGVLVLLARAWRLWSGIKELAQSAEALPYWQERTRHLAARFGKLHAVQVLCSSRISTPTLIGWARPVVLLPLAVCSGFPVAQVELILAHELAHLRRWDHFANLFQVILETLLFYHPVVHWISRDVRNERELCCDALALRATGGSRRELAAALVDLEEFRESHSGLALAANGGVLLDRVGYLAGETSVAKPQTRFVAVVLGLLVAVLALAVMRREAQVRQDIAAATRHLAASLTMQRLPVMLRVPILAIKDLAPSRLDFADSARSIPIMASTDRTDTDQLAVPRTLAALQVAPLFDLALTKIAPVIPAPARDAVTPPPETIDETVPVALHVVQPVYPGSALEQGVEGEVVVEFALNEDGSVRDPAVIESAPGNVFDESALHALAGWRFSASSAAVAGKRYRQTFSFSLHALRGVAVTDEIPAKPGCMVMTGTHICRTDIGSDTAVKVSSLLH
ncbi:MAG TPA: M56 family metallopeptidase [Rhodanobacteraceae bacterium]|nr:M56 family metallopeptidase [Rhodanobacteraceae bacterium]